MTLVAICLVIPQCLHLSGTVTEIWRLKDNGITPLMSHDHLTPEGRLPIVSVVHSDHASI